MFAAPLGLLALLAVPGVLALHLFRRRFRPRTVSALFLWAARERNPQAGRRLERLWSSPSLWCELLGALLLALAIAGPRGCAAGEARHLVAVVDGSASMGAGAGGDSALERARARFEAELADLPAGSRATLIASGPRPRLLAGPAAPAEQARAALRAFEPRAPHHDPDIALALALELAVDGEVLWLTDRLPADPPDPRIELEACGRPLANVGLVGARREHTLGGGERLTLVVASFADAPSERRLVVRADDVVLAQRELRLEPGERRVLELDLPAAEGLEGLAVLAELSPDAFALDDRAALVAEPRRVVSLAVDLELDAARRLGLAEGDSPAGRWARSVPRTVEHLGPRGPHLALGRAPTGGPATWCVVLEDLGAARADFVGPFFAERNHPLLEGLTLEGLVWSADPELLLPGVPLVSAGNLPLLSEERDGERLVLRLNLDPERSSLARSPDWPILLANLVEARRRELPGPARTNLALGESLVHRPATPTALTLRSPSGRERTFEVRDTLVIDDLDEPGIHELTAAGAQAARFALSFLDATESDLRELSSGSRAGAAPRAGIERASSRWTTLLVALALAALLLDGWFLRPRAGGGAA